MRQVHSSLTATTTIEGEGVIARFPASTSPIRWIAQVSPVHYPIFYTVRVAAAGTRTVGRRRATRAVGCTLAPRLPQPCTAV